LQASNGATIQAAGFPAGEIRVNAIAPGQLDGQAFQRGGGGRET
jgi:hypothetical protein